MYKKCSAVSTAKPVSVDSTVSLKEAAPLQKKVAPILLSFSQVNSLLSILNGIVLRLCGKNKSPISKSKLMLFQLE